MEHTYIPQILKFVMLTVGSRISRKVTKHTDKCRNNKKITEKVRHKVYMYYTRSIQQTVQKKLLHIL